NSPLVQAWLSGGCLDQCERAAARSGVARRLNGVRARFSGSDADCLLDRRYEDLAVTDAPGFGRPLNGLDGLVEQLVGNHDLDFYFGQKVDDVLGAPVELGVPLLTSEAFGLEDRYALQADLLKSLFHFIELEGFDDCFDLLHPFLPDGCLLARHSLSRRRARWLPRRGLPEISMRWCYSGSFLSRPSESFAY